MCIYYSCCCFWFNPFTLSLHTTGDRRLGHNKTLTKLTQNTATTYLDIAWTCQYFIGDMFIYWSHGITSRHSLLYNTKENKYSPKDMCNRWKKKYGSTRTRTQGWPCKHRTTELPSHPVISPTAFNRDIIGFTTSHTNTYLWPWYFF